MKNFPTELKAEIVQYTKGFYYQILDILEYEMGTTSRQEQATVFHQAFFKNDPMTMTRWLYDEGLGDELINCLTLSEVRSDAGVMRVFCSEGRLDLVRLIVDKGLTTEDIRKMDALCWACRSGNVELVKFIIGKGLTLNDLREEFDYVIGTICYKGYDEVLRILLEEGIAKEDIQAGDGLHRAMCEKEPRIFRMLMEQKLDKSYILSQIAKSISIEDEDQDVIENLLNKYICS